ncbi:methyl-accepting chemotaxis protein [Nisaea sp.]|uniref:methyl-accepting chemotaxis protein n=1 Tax=Nisaea sp. TaxID=2024842 RepID=UPI003B526C57
MSVLIVGVFAYIQFSREMEARAVDRLAALSQARISALAAYLQSIREDLVITAQNEIVLEATKSFEAAFTEINADGSARDVLQRHYIENNPHPTGSKHLLDVAPDGSEYSDLHERFHPWFRELQQRRDYYDVFLVAANGDLIYSVFKELDYATNLNSGKWKDTDIARVFTMASKLRAPGEVAFTDFAPYAPSYDAPASFIAAPILDGGELLGTLIFQMPIGRIDALMTDVAGMGRTGQTILVGEDFLMRSSSRALGSDVILKTSVEADSVRRALGGETGWQKSTGYDGQEVYSAFSPLTFEGVTWAVLGEMDVEEILAAVHDMRTVMLTVGLAIFVLLSAVGYFLARSALRPVVDMTGVMDALSGGDLSVAVPGVGRGDEIGRMAGSVQVFRDNMVRNEELRAEQERARLSREERAQHVEGVTREFDQQVSEVLKSVAAATTQLDATAKSMASIAERAEGQASSVAAASEEATTNVQTVAAAAEQLTMSISEIGAQVSESTRISAEAAGQAEETRESVIGLDQAAQKVGEIVDMINDIAEQTNLLALNATIEAARAGEAGKGFAVVASEVKNLANQTAQATDEIAGQISSMQSETSKAVDAIRTISETVNRISTIATGIASAVEEQNAATSEISRNVQQAAEGTTEVSSSIVSVNEGAQETGAAASQVLQTAQEVAHQSNTLNGIVDRFLNEVRTS